MFFMDIFKTGYGMVKENLDLKKGAFFGGLSGIIVGLINSREGLGYALTSGSKETAKCFVIGSLNMGVCRRLATTVENKTKALVYATVVPAMMSTGLTYAVHAYLQGTPHPVESTLPTLLSAPFFLGLAIRERRLHEKKNKLESLEKI
jgi:hypothetical protein